MGDPLHAQSLARDHQRDLAGSLACIVQALVLLDDDPETADLRLVLLVNRTGHLDALHRTREAGAALQQARALAERTGTARGGTVQLMAAQHYYLTGRWDDAQAELEALAELPETGHSPLFPNRS